LACAEVQADAVPNAVGFDSISAPRLERSHEFGKVGVDHHERRLRNRKTEVRRQPRGDQFAG